jgi:hypothetical protein
MRALDDSLLREEYPFHPKGSRNSLTNALLFQPQRRAAFGADSSYRLIAAHIL